MPSVSDNPSSALSATEAADLLNLGLDFLVALADRGEIPFNAHPGGAVFRAIDVSRYKRARDARRTTAMEHLADFSRDFY